MEGINYRHYNSSPCLPTPAVPLISAALVALAIIDLLKPYFLIISGSGACGRSRITTPAGGGGGGMH